MDKRIIDINCDMGESTHLWKYSIDQDIEMMNYVSAVNIACGAHAGDPAVAAILIEAALQKKIAIGAHPSFYDRENFGRSNCSVPPNQLFHQLIFQIGGLQSIVSWNGGVLHHVKPHGALYNIAAIDPIYAGVIIDAMKELAPNAQLYCLSGSKMVEWAKKAGIAVKEEAFSDRTYQNNGTLTPRSQENSLIENKTDMLKQVLQMASESSVLTTNGNIITLNIDTICIHGDGKNALEFAQAIKEELSLKGIVIQWT